MARLEQQLTEMFTSTVEDLGFELVGVEFVRAGKHSTLRVYIDHAEGISVDHCAEVSHQISAIMDVEDPISTEYFLEVSSPGTDRRLFKAAHYLESVGEKAAIKLNTPQQGRRNFTGEIKALEGDMVVVEVDGVEHQLLLTNIEKANIIPNLEF
ncbi:MAG: ribosome maturation factor RimP [Algicola sp.]|nr:ribosome maturation factor RimP [Algicola sp.]